LWLKILAPPPNYLQVFFLREHAYFGFKYRKYAEAIYEALCGDAFYITMEASVHGREPEFINSNRFH
jgi:hypothetical protein